MADKQSWEEVAIATAQARAREESLHLWQMEETPPFDYRWEHIKAVVAMADNLAKELGADDEVVRAAAWLHDLAKEELAEGRDSHGEASAQEAKKILEATDFPKDKIPRVMEAIAQHVGLFREEPLPNLEAAILWDADKLSKLGATSLVHFHMSNPARQPGMTTEHVLAREREWLDLAKRTVESMNTSPGKKMARQRYKFLEAFYRQLARELGKEG